EDAPVGVRRLGALGRLGDVLGHLDLAVAVGVRLPDGADLVLLGDVDPRLVDGLGRRLLADALDVVRLVGDVGDVDVDQVQADLVELSPPCPPASCSTTHESKNTPPTAAAATNSRSVPPSEPSHSI